MNKIPSSHLSTKRISKAFLPTVFGDFTIYAYQSQNPLIEHAALVCGAPDHHSPLPLVRVHSECLTGDIFGSKRCDCGPQLQLAMKAIAQRGKGVLIYIRGHEGRGIGLGEKLKAYCLQDEGLDTVEANIALGHMADSRRYDVAVDILIDLHVTKLELLTNNPEKKTFLEKSKICVSKRTPLIIEKTKENINYLETKKQKFGHWL